MTELEMIAEWRKGCSCASKERPEECTECTRGLVDALEAKLRAATPPAAKGTTYGYKASFRAGEFEQARAALAQQPAAQAAGLTDEQIEEVWNGVEWKDLSPVHEGFEKALRLRFARALLSRAAPSVEPVAYVECRECGRCGHTGINDAHSQAECCSNCDWTGPAPKEDVCPGCAQTGTMRAACPKCGSMYRLLCETTVGAATKPSARQAEPESPMKAAADALRRKTELEQAHQDGYRDGFKAAQAMLDKAGAVTEETALETALKIMANLEDRNGVLDGVDDDTKADIADEIALAILAASKEGE